MTATPSSRSISLTSLRLVREKSVGYARRIRAAQDVYEIVAPLAADLAQETFYILGLDTKNRVTVLHPLAVGSGDGVAIDFASLLKVVLLANASGIVVSHNHPSGCTDPSVEDGQLNRRLGEVLRLVGLRFLDHVIVGVGGFYSFAESGTLGGP